MSLIKQSFFKPFYDYQISTYRMISTKVKGSLIPKKSSLVYDKIDCAVWKGVVSNLSDNPQSTQTDSNNYEVNLKPENTDVIVGDNVEIFYNNITQWRYIITNIVYNDDHMWTLDNIKLLVKSIENANPV